MRVRKSAAWLAKRADILCFDRGDQGCVKASGFVSVL